MCLMEWSYSETTTTTSEFDVRLTKEWQERSDAPGNGGALIRCSFFMGMQERNPPFVTTYNGVIFCLRKVSRQRTFRSVCYIFLFVQ